MHPIRSTARLSFAALALAVSLALLLPVTAFAWGTNAFSSTSEQQLVQLTNQARAAAGRKALQGRHADRDSPGRGPRT